jgi:hypothetical protein
VLGFAIVFGTISLHLVAEEVAGAIQFSRSEAFWLGHGHLHIHYGAILYILSK